MKYQHTIIRTKEQLDNIEKKNLALYNAILTELEKEQAPESYPLVYQYKQGKPGESVVHENNANRIGEVSDLHIDGCGNLVADVTIGDMFGKAHHFQGTIDNLVFQREQIDTGDREIVLTELKQLVVYDCIEKEEANRKKEYESRVQKLYNAPTEDYEAEAGGRILKIKELCDTILQEVTKSNPNSGDVCAPTPLQKEINLARQIVERKLKHKKEVDYL